MPSTPIDTYRRQIQKEVQAGNATEHTHRPALKTLIEALAAGVTATNEPKRVECGAPDYVISKKSAHGPVTLGYVEAKDVGKPLDEVERSDQMKRYLPALSNLILTDYLEFRWYVGGDCRQTARLASVSKRHKLTSEKDGAKSVTELLTAFLSSEAEPIADPKTLALRMARLTHFIRDMIVTAFESKSASATLTDLRGAFEKALLPHLRTSQFADMFAQTLAYGLFAARCNHHGPKGSFKRLGAATEIPKTNPFLRQLFETITGTALDEEPYAGFVDDLAQLLADTDMEAVLEDFGKRVARQDPVVHFYETFLAAYDPKLREARGVYYTPEPVVSYLVRSVDYLLKARFECPSGVADTATVEYEREEERDGKVMKVKVRSPRVLILDPACGTGTFLYAVIDHIRNEFMREGNGGMWSGYVRNHLLPRMFGFELLMAPYAVAHFKLGMQLAGHDLSTAEREKWAYDFSSDDRLRIYLTNTLEEAERRAQLEFGFFRTLTEEANAAVEVKRDLPILAVIGNPPYSRDSFNKGAWITRLMERYKVTVRHEEIQRQALSDDYAKFIRFAHYRIERTGQGLIALITNNGWLDGPLFRDMRKALMESFTGIWVLNLHGDSRKRALAPGGVKDENVFDIQQGVSIAVLMRTPFHVPSKRIQYADLWGPRVDKYGYLYENSLEDTRWQELAPRGPFWQFVPSTGKSGSEWDGMVPISEAFKGDVRPGRRLPFYGAGFTTRHDDFAVGMSGEEVLKNVREFLRPDATEEELRERFRLCTTAHWSFNTARDKLTVTEARKDLQRFLYRPFDFRYTIYNPLVIGEMRPEIMRHLKRQNIALVSTRRVTGRPFDNFFVSNTLVEYKAGSHDRNTQVFPLYLYPPAADVTGGQDRLDLNTPHWPAGKEGRRPNLSPEFIADFEKRTGLSFTSDGKGDLREKLGPEDIFNYMYAVFYSPTYRTRYSEFLNSDFPRVPLTSDVSLFRLLRKLGGELVALHLLESPLLDSPVAHFPVKGSNAVEKGYPKYLIFAEKVGEPSPPWEKYRVYINGSYEKAGSQYFAGIPPEVWDFHIGGYQVCEKWLKDRRGRTLTYDDQVHYCKIVTAIKETIRLMAEIESAIPKWPIE